MGLVLVFKALFNMEHLSSSAVLGTPSTSRSSIRRSTSSNRALRNLERIASGERVIDVHRGDTRGWWPLAEQGLIDKAVADPRFSDFVTVMELCTDLGLEEVGAELISN